MSEYISTFISLFGSIFAITMAFLILLYESAKNKLNISKSNLSSEIENFLNCKHTKELKILQGQDEDYFRLKMLTEFKYGRIDDEKITKVIEILTNKINCNTTSQSDKEHLKIYHLNDISAEQKNYNDNKKYFTEKLPSYAKSVIAIPFLITILFIFIAKYECYISCKLKGYFDFTIISIVIFGLAFIYFTSVKAIQDLNKINL